MSTSSRVAGILFSVVVIGALLVLFLGGERERPPSVVAGQVDEREAASAPGPTSDEAPSQRPPAGDPASDLAASVDAFLEKIPVEPFPRPEEVLDEAREGTLGPIDYRLKLERSLRHPGGPAEAAGMLLGMTHDPETLRFQTALALSKRLDPDSAGVLLDGLTDAPPAVRPQAVFALRGSPDAGVSQTFVDLYTADRDDAVRAQAAFALGERGERVDALVLERARQRAREDLASATDVRLMKAASDVLGVPPLSPDDRRFLEGILASDPNSQRRMAALQALASAQVSPQELAPLLRGVVSDPTASDDLRAQAQAVLEAVEAADGSSPGPSPGSSSGADSGEAGG